MTLPPLWISARELGIRDAQVVWDHPAVITNRADRNLRGW